MVPLYAVVSFLSYYYYLHAIYYETLRDCYEAYALANFYWLLLTYCGETKDDQKHYFVSMPMRDNWSWPVGLFQRWFHREGKPPPKRWLRIIHIGIFQYCAVRVTCTVVACITQYYGIYCAKSNSMHFAHVYVEVFEAIGVTIAMYCLIDLYFELRTKQQSLSEYAPGEKGEATNLDSYSITRSQGGGSEAGWKPNQRLELEAASMHNYESDDDLVDHARDQPIHATTKTDSKMALLFQGHRVEGKVASIKLVIFFSFWQAVSLRPLHNDIH